MCLLRGTDWDLKQIPLVFKTLNKYDAWVWTEFAVTSLLTKDSGVLGITNMAMTRTVEVTSTHCEIPTSVHVAICVRKVYE